VVQVLLVETSKMVVQVFASWLDYCNSLLSGIGETAWFNDFSSPHVLSVVQHAISQDTGQQLWMAEEHFIGPTASLRLGVGTVLDSARNWSLLLC